MRRLLLSLFLLLPSLVSGRLAISPGDYLASLGSSAQWETEEVQQPPRPARRRHGKYVISFFYWTTNSTSLRELNDENITIDMNTVDLGIVCKSDRTPVVLRLVPADKADSCSFDGGVVAICPDHHKIPLLYADVHGPGDYVLTTFSDGTLDGRQATSGGFCKQGLKVPIKIVSSTRDSSKFHDSPILEFPEKPKPSSASAVSIVVAVVLLLTL